MKAAIKTFLSAPVLTALSYIGLGIVFILLPGISYVTITYIAAAIFLFMGLISIGRYIIYGITEGRLNNYFATGLVLILCAVFMYLESERVMTFIPVLLGGAIIIDGIIKLQRCIDLARLKFEGWLFVLTLAVMSLATGVIFVVKPIDTARTMVIILGVALCFCGLTALVVSGYVSKKLKNHLKKLHPETPEVPAPSAAAAAAPAEVPAPSAAAAPAPAEVPAPFAAAAPAPAEVPAPSVAAAPAPAEAPAAAGPVSDKAPAEDPPSGAGFTPELPHAAPDEIPFIEATIEQESGKESSHD